MANLRNEQTPKQKNERISRVPAKTYQLRRLQNYFPHEDTLENHFRKYS